MTTETVDTTERLDDLAQIISAYNQVTENLRASHDALRGEVVRLQKELASTDAQLQRSRRLAALGEMAAGIAHEIRNPLGAIQLYAELIVQDMKSIDAPTETSETAGKIAAAVKGLNAVVNDVLTFSREIAPRPQSLEVEQVFDGALAAITAPNVTIHREPTDLCMHADAALVNQVMVNLLRNAVEATEGKGSITLAARIDSDNDKQVVITVADDGPGIAGEAIDRIFNPFFTTRNTGTGLGLAIVHRIIDAHNGAITVHNDGGAVFEIRLPIAGSLRDPGLRDSPGDDA